MKIFLYAILLPLLFFISIFSSAAYPTAEQKRVAVFHFSTDNPNSSLHKLITDDFINALTKTDKFMIAERSEIEKILKEQNLQYSDEFSDSKMVELGKLIGAEIVFVGILYNINGYYKLTVRGINTETGIVLLSESVTAKNQKALNNAVSDMAYTVSYYSYTGKRGMDISFGGSISAQLQVKSSVSLGSSDFFIWPFYLRFGPVMLPFSATFLVDKNTYFGFSISPGYSLSYIPVAVTNPLSQSKFNLALNTFHLKAGLKLKRQLDRRNFRFIFEALLQTDFDFLNDFGKNIRGYDFLFALGPVFHFGSEYRKRTNFTVEYSGFFGILFKLVNSNYYTLSTDSVTYCITAGADIRLNFYHFTDLKKKNRLPVKKKLQIIGTKQKTE